MVFIRSEKLTRDRIVLNKDWVVLKWRLIRYLKGTNFCGFCGFGPKPQNWVPSKFFKCEKQRLNNSQNGSNILSSEKSEKLSSCKKSQKCEPQKLVPAKISSLKVVQWWRSGFWWHWTISMQQRTIISGRPCLTNVRVGLGTKKLFIE